MNNPSSNKIRFGVIGTNYITDKVLAGAMQHPRFELAAVYSRTQEKATEFAAKYNVTLTFTSLEEMAQSPHIDAVYIASPNSFHAPQSILFMQHGKHVLCEKPLASNVREIKEMIAASEKYNVTLMEAMKPTLTPNFLVTKSNIDKIGTIRRYFSCYCQYSSRYDQLKEGIVLNAFDPSLSNGALVDIGIYTIYPMVVLFGKPNKISAYGIMLHTGVDGQGAINFEYDDMHATVLFSKIADSALPTEIQGENGTITLDRINIIGDVSLILRNGTKTTLSKPNLYNEFYYEITEFIDLIESGKRESLINSHKNSLITMEIMDEIRRQIGLVFPADLN